MKRVLIIYATVEGQTHKIADTIAARLRSLGFEVELLDTNVAFSFDPSRYAAVVAGAPVHASGYPRSFRRFVKFNSSALSKTPSAFFSVCLGILQKTDQNVQSAERKIVHDLFAEAGWTPDVWEIFAGALSYTKYGWIKRQVMKQISRRAGVATDTTQDYEYTDWDEVRRFVDSFVATFLKTEASWKNPAPL